MASSRTISRAERALRRLDALNTMAFRLCAWGRQRGLHHRIPWQERLAEIPPNAEPAATAIPDGAGARAVAESAGEYSIGKPGSGRRISLMPVAAGVLIATLTHTVSAVPLGRFAPAPALSLYLVNDATPCELRITVRHGQTQAPDRVLVRLLGPDEQVCFWKYIEYVPAADLLPDMAPGIELRDAASAPQPGDAIIDQTLPLSRAGVYQLRVSVGEGNGTVDIELSRELPYGVSFQNGDYRPWCEAAKLYAYIPPHAETLNLRKGPVVVRDAAGAELARLAADGSADIAVKATDVVWELEFPQPKDWCLRAAPFPFILCPSADAARAIRASVETLADGTVVCHKFQARIAALLPALLAPDKVGTAEDLIVPLATCRDAWLAEPTRNLLLKDGYLPAVEHWLRQQNVDPSSHWSGCMDGWQDKVDLPAPDGRWDRFCVVPGANAGVSPHYGLAAEHLARAALTDSPTSPYRGKAQLLYRAAAACLRDLMALSEAETWPGTADLDPYPGNMAFTVAQKTLPPFGFVAPHLPEDIRAVWTDAVRHIIDRHITDSLVTCRNQSSHWLVAHQAFADGTGDPVYRDMAKVFARRWCRGQHPAGFHMEATGPCSSYIGMTHWHEAVYVRMSTDPAVIESVRRGYRFFNHTVAPEPDGQRILGGFNFNHRVGEGFYGEQWSGAKGILDDLPEIGLWAAPPPTPEQIEEAKAKIEAFLAKPAKPPYADISNWRYLAWCEPNRSMVFPALEPEPFIRVFADELVAVKRPGYYAVCYVGKPAAGDHYIRGRENLRVPFADGIEGNGGVLPEVRKITPFLGGGLTGFWTPAYGHALMAADWAPTTHHGLIATQPDGNRYWEDYFAHTHQLDEAAGKLSFQGQVEAQPLDYQRNYWFGDQAIDVELILTARQDVTLQRLVENLPFVRGGWKARGAQFAATGVSTGDVEADRFTVTDTTGAGVEVVLDSKHKLRLVPEGLKAGGWRQLQFGRIEIELPATLKAGEGVVLAYRIQALAGK
ncbi:MAG: hypothetical protein A3K19_06650 [Lentisphaerae bacterium RIFOXYB12_FULL_65_16]|nr:MAG: hypothetical protein A3K18_00360 [Lentisphaerae bacterium RIFOXYA12_64_32]OGV93118.1 MAG: hypothetical protein A3K19_06650 [Lentisphaerae bacterium RIFOXYB12_FULL_65_16]